MIGSLRFNCNRSESFIVRFELSVHGRVDRASDGRDNKFTMLRVLMVLEDYGELMFLQTVLKKIGFDVDSTQNPRLLSDNLLAMNPDVLVMTAYGKRVKGVEIAKTVRKTRGIPRIVLIRGPGSLTDADPAIEGWLESPVGAISLLNLLGDLCGLNKELLNDKFQKLRAQDLESDESTLYLQGDPGAEPAQELRKSTDTEGGFRPPPLAPPKADEPSAPVLSESTVTTEERQERYRKFLSERPEHIGFGAKKIQAEVKALRKLENTAALAELEQERKAFVEQLFSKKKS
jgi:CheY-like chemotaxis protein